QRRELVELFPQAAQHDGVPPTIGTWGRTAPYTRRPLGEQPFLMRQRECVDSRRLAVGLGDGRTRPPFVSRMTLSSSRRVSGSPARTRKTPERASRSYDRMCAKSSS